MKNLLDFGTPSKIAVGTMSAPDAHPLSPKIAYEVDVVSKHHNPDCPVVVPLGYNRGEPFRKEALCSDSCARSRGPHCTPTTLVHSRHKGGERICILGWRLRDQIRLSYDHFRRSFSSAVRRTPQRSSRVVISPQYQSRGTSLSACQKLARRRQGFRFGGEATRRSSLPSNP